MTISIIDHVGSKAGMDYYSDSLAKGFANNNQKVTIFSNFIGINKKNVSYKKYFDNHTSKSNFFKLINFIFAIIKSSFQSKKNSTDFVILHIFTTNLLSLILVAIPKLFGLKTIIISHDISSFVNNDNNLFQKMIYGKLSDFIVVHNKFSYDELIKTNSVKNKNKIFVCKHGGYLDYINFNQDKNLLRKELGLEIEKKYMLFFGQIKDVKGLDILLEALSKVDNDINLIIAGKPWKADFSKYENLINKHNLEERVFKLIKFIDDKDREKLFFAADVNILPYKIIYQSGVLLMAMSHKLPVIASDLLPNKEIITDMENGLLFKSEDSNDLALKINNFFSDSNIKNKLSSNSYLTIKEDYSWDKIASEYIVNISKKSHLRVI